MAFVGEVQAVLKADNSDFRAKMSEAGEATEKLDKSLKKFGLAFGGVGILVSAFKAVVDYARDLETPMDANVKRAQAFAKGLDEAKNGLLETGAKALGVVNHLGEWIGRQIAIVKYGKEQVATAEAIDKQAQETLAAIEKDKKLNEEIAKIKAQTREEDRKRSEEAQKQLSLEEQIAVINGKIQAQKDILARTDNTRKETAEAELELSKQRTELVKVEGDLKKKNADEQKKADDDAKKRQEENAKQMFEMIGKNQKLKFEALSVDEKIAKVQARILEYEDIINAAKKDGLDYTDIENVLLEDRADLEKLIKEKKEKQNEENKKLLLTDEQIAKLSEEDLQKQADLLTARIAKAKAEGLVTAEMEKQLAIIQKMLDKKQKELDITFKIVGAYYTEQTDRELEDNIRKLQASLFQRGQTFGSNIGGVGAQGAAYDPLGTIEAKQLAQAQAELEARNLARQRVGRYGEEGAYNLFYQGKATEFERLLDYVTAPADAKRTADALTTIERRMANSPFFPRV